MTIRITTFFVATLFTLLPISTTVAASDVWEFTIAFPMIWAPEINGKVEGGGDRIDINVPFDQIVEDLNFGFMGDFYATRGKWSYALKLNYLQTKDETVTDSLKSPIWDITIAPSHQVKTELRMSANDLLIRYQTHKNTFLYTGVRYFFTKVDMDITPLGTGIIAIDKHINIADEHLFDWLVGIDLGHWFSQRFGISLSADAGIAGDNDKDYNVTAIALYRLNKLHNIWAGYRYLEIGNETDSDVGKLEVKFAQQGPMIGWAFTF